jgi:hypothetical protein
MAILAQLMIVLGMIVIGLRHFDNLKTGMAAATLYLLLPYTALWTGNVTHALPGALLVWAVALYRWPLLSGGLIGFAFGTIYYPLFLLPLWISFYWRRGLWRFLIGMTVMVLVMVLVLFITSIATGGVSMFLARLQQMFGVRIPIGEDLSGAWHYWTGVYRFPILAAFVGLSLSFAIWPVQKNLATLMSGSAALMLGVQFWHAHSGGLALAWHIPLMLMTIFRPNLDDRTATSWLGLIPTPMMLQAAIGSRPSSSARLTTSSLSLPGLSHTSSHPLAAISSRALSATGGGKYTLTRSSRSTGTSVSDAYTCSPSIVPPLGFTG